MAMVQRNLDSFTQCNEGSLSALHILESTNPIFTAGLEQIEKKRKQAEFELEKAMKEFNEKAHT